MAIAEERSSGAAPLPGLDLEIEVTFKAPDGWAFSNPKPTLDQPGTVTLKRGPNQHWKFVGARMLGPDDERQFEPREPDNSGGKLAIEDKCLENGSFPFQVGILYGGTLKLSPDGANAGGGAGDREHAAGDRPFVATPPVIVNSVPGNVP